MHYLQTGSGVAWRLGLSDLPDLVEVGTNALDIIEKQLTELVWGEHSGGTLLLCIGRSNVYVVACQGGAVHFNEA